MRGCSNARAGGTPVGRASTRRIGARGVAARRVAAPRIAAAAMLTVVAAAALTACGDGASDSSDATDAAESTESTDSSGGGAAGSASTTTTRSPDVSDDTGATPTALTASGDGELAGVTLTGELTVADDQLHIAYTVDNQSGAPVVVAGAVPEPAGSSFSPDAVGAWVTASTQGFVTVGRWPIRQPDETTGDRGRPQSLYVVEVESGGSLDGVVELAWPLEGRHPYYAPDVLPVPLPDPVESLRLCIGVSAASAAADATAGAPTVEEGGVTWLAVPMDQLAGTLCTEPVPLM